MSSQYRADADAIDEESESSQDHGVSFNSRVLPAMLRYRKPESSKGNTRCRPNRPAKLFGRKMSPMIANKLTTIPPIRNLITNSLIECPFSFS
jgi:hypothetical protein